MVLDNGQRYRPKAEYPVTLGNLGNLGNLKCKSLQIQDLLRLPKAYYLATFEGCQILRRLPTNSQKVANLSIYYIYSYVKVAKVANKHDEAAWQTGIIFVKSAWLLVFTFFCRYWPLAGNCRKKLTWVKFQQKSLKLK